MTGLHKSPDFGYSLDFAQHRSYVPGDSPKFIDWSVVARQDKFLTKQYEAESNLRAYFILDSSASMFVPSETKWKRATELIALSAALLEKQRDAFGLYEIGEGHAEFFEASNKKENLENLLHHVKGREQEPNGNADFTASLEILGGRIPKRSQLVLLTDLYHTNPEVVLERLGRLKEEGHDVSLAVLIDSTIEQSKEGLAGALVKDPETGRTSIIDRALNQEFANFATARIRDLKEGSGSRGIRFYPLDCTRPALENFMEMTT